MSTKKTSEETTTIIRTLKGTVVSASMDKTAVVAVHTMKSHPKYHKRYGVTVKYKAHDPNNSAVVGDQVTIQAMRPTGKGKRWMLVAQSAK